MPYTKPYNAACAGRAPRHAHRSGTSATSTTGPRPTGGKHNPVRTPATIAAPRRIQLGRTRVWSTSCIDSCIDAGGDASVIRSGAVVAALPGGVGEAAERQQQEARLAEELVGASRHDTRRAVDPVVTVAFLLLELLFVVLEGGAGGALLEQRVERRLDVVGVELLVEVDDALFVVLLVGGGRGVVGHHRHRDLHLRDRVDEVVVEEIDVVSVVDERVLFVEVL